MTDIPYFEGDFWPNVVEDTIKELDQEAKQREASEKDTNVSAKYLYRVLQCIIGILLSGYYVVRFLNLFIYLFIYFLTRLRCYIFRIFFFFFHLGSGT